MEPITVARPTTTPSNLNRRQLCPGSARLETGLTDEDSHDARVGRLFHKYWTNPQFDRTFLTDDERDILELSDRLLLDVLNRLAFEVIHEPSTRAGFNQKRHDDRQFQPSYHVEQTITTNDGRLTGTPDSVYVWPRRKSALVNDLKSGFAVVERAELNLQLRGYAVLVFDAYDSPDNIYVSILQPRLWSPSERITMAHYIVDDIKRSRDEINAIIDASEQPDAPLRAGEDQCRFCRAKLMCPAFREAMALPVAAFETEQELSKAKREAVIEQRIKGCSDTELERVLEACKLASFVDESVRNEARTRIERGAFTNYTLGKASEVRTITNIRKAIPMLDLAHVATRDQILDICTISLEKLQNTYRAKYGGTFQNARDKVNRVLNSVIAREPRKPRILKK
jgi:hypothetical protein